jgi:hypothetical protein
MGITKKLRSFLGRDYALPDNFAHRAIPLDRRAPNHPQVASNPLWQSTCQSVTNREKNQAVAKALIRADNRESLRAIVLACTTPLPAARCSSGCAVRNASTATALSPLAIAVSTFLINVRMRDFRAALRAVRTLV